MRVGVTAGGGGGIRRAGVPPTPNLQGGGGRVIVSELRGHQRWEWPQQEVTSLPWQTFLPPMLFPIHDLID